MRDPRTPAPARRTVLASVGASGKSCWQIWSNSPEPSPLRDRRAVRLDATRRTEYPGYIACRLESWVGQFMTSSVANPSDAVILDAVRTPVGKRNGSLADIHPVDLSARVLRALLSRNNVEPDMIDDVVWGVVGQVGDQSVNVARSAVLAAGIPDSVRGVTLARRCGSSQKAVTFAAASVLAGHYDA